MSRHSYTRCWIHVVWPTLRREKMLGREARIKISEYLSRYAQSKSIPMRVNFVNADHVHALIDQPSGMTIEDIIKLLKGASSHWINQERLTSGKFSWARGYGAFSVSESHVSRVIDYVKNQDDHHRTKSFAEEYTRILGAYNLQEDPENR